MTDAKQAITKLDAVNRMLASIGQSPVNTLSGTLPKDVNKAVLALDNSTRDVCTRGWSFNSDREYPLSVDGNDKIPVPAAASSIEPSYGENYTMRYSTDGLYLYNNDTFSFTFAALVKCNVIWLFDFDELPQHARHYIAMRAGREFQATLVGSQVLYSFTKEMENDAWADFRRIEKRNKNYNINGYGAKTSRSFNYPR